ncbi:MAG: FAD-dependent oxidoreductase, partial [Planctomycetota bacterium]|nr:FAD-dependent oxidoreductase [Planctomycetota bacterium]
FAGLGSEIVLFERQKRLLPKEDTAVGQHLENNFKANGITTLLNCQDLRLEPATDTHGIQIDIRQNGANSQWKVDQLLVATGRTANTDRLQLPNAGVKYGHSGIQVNQFLQTSNPNIYAGGDVCSGSQYTSIADRHARIIVQNALFAVGPFGRKSTTGLHIPRTTYTSPEVAQIGITEDAAIERGVPYDCYQQDLSSLDRTQLGGSPAGYIKVLTQPGKDRILGVTVVCEAAGELINLAAFALSQGHGLRKLGTIIFPYPSFSDAYQRLSDQVSRQKLTPFTRRLLDLFKWINVGR